MLVHFLPRSCEREICGAPSWNHVTQNVCAWIFAHIIWTFCWPHSLWAQNCRGEMVMVVSFWAIYQIISRIFLVFLNVFLQLDSFALTISPLRCFIAWGPLIKDHNLCIAYRLTIQGQSGKFNQFKAWWWRLSLVLEGKVLAVFKNVKTRDL